MDPNDPFRATPSGVICGRLRFSIHGQDACDLPVGHAGEHRFVEHECPDCGTRHGVCPACGTTHGQSHETNCRLRRRPASAPAYPAGPCAARPAEAPDFIEWKAAQERAARAAPDARRDLHEFLCFERAALALDAVDPELADRIRDRMDTLWYRLCDEGRARLNGRGMLGTDGRFSAPEDQPAPSEAAASADLDALDYALDRMSRPPWLVRIPLSGGAVEIHADAADHTVAAQVLPSDAVGIVALRNAAPALVSELRALRAVAVAACDLREQCAPHDHPDNRCQRDWNERLARLDAAAAALDEARRG